MTAIYRLSTRVSSSGPSRAGGASLGVLSVHVDGTVCRVGCEYCYLGARTDGVAGAPAGPLLEELLDRLSYDEIAVAVSEPAAGARPTLAAIRAAAARRRRPVAVTTTLAVAASDPDLLDGVQRLNLSLDPRKGRVSPARVAALARLVKGRARAHGPLEVVLIVSMISPAFAARLVEGGLLAALVDLPDVDKVALNALKPPPPWCDRAFWMRTLSSLRPLLARALDTRLFLDCYVAARLVGTGGCPARPDLSTAHGGAIAFRSCVYQATPDFAASTADEFARRLEGFVAPAACPFPVE
jgi:hypothetical protein